MTEPIYDTLARAGLWAGVYVALALFALGIARLRRVPVTEALGLQPPSRWTTAVRDAVVLAVAGRALAAAWAWLLSATGANLPGADFDPTTLFGEDVLGAILAVLIAVIVAPVAEELLFRGALLGAVGARWGAAAGIVVSALAFSALHVTPYAVPPIFAFALLLGMLRVNTGSLYPPVIAHVLFNGIALAATWGLKSMGLA